ncbi:MAG: 3-phosphoshikimate 1-carboxyvinyltransferase, partial [Deltaproteobacteria bacterium]|nr:3-phosphoshikimate 1-carboxyvinyltransferase [Deltaproteobacteria bacterium]MBW2531806.1 3-phosphoshikimate 1-carboxyvinyltransferase [Deltaproteobacteria bacterium]
RQPDRSDPQGAERLTLIGARAGRAATPRSAAPIVLDCGESALTMRLFAPIAATLASAIRLEASGGLRRRPMQMLEEPLRALGVAVQTDGGYPPLELRGDLSAGDATLDGSTTSQTLSGLLMALPTCAGESRLIVRDLVSEGYVALTRSVMRAFGIHCEPPTAVTGSPNQTVLRIPGHQHYRAGSFTVEGDWSGGAYLLVAGALAGRVRVSGLAQDSPQPDRTVVAALEQAGAEIEADADGIVVEQAELRAIDVDGTSCPDLFPPLAALACHGHGESVIRGAGRLAHKESHRGEALAAELGKLGAAIEIQGDELRVRGGPLHGGTVDSRGDHRIAMACAVAALRASGEVHIADAGCVAKSYPAFFDHLARLGVVLS